MTTASLHPPGTTAPPQDLTTFHSFCLVVGQVLMCVSSFFWDANGSYTVDCSVIVILSMVFWAAGLQGVFAMFNEKNPWYARIGLLYAMYGCLGGAGFGFEGLFSVLLDAGAKIGVTAHEKFPLQMNLALYWSGPAFPLSILFLGILLMYSRLANPVVGTLLILGAIAFPLSRISRIEWIAHIADFILLAGVFMLIRRSFNGR